MPADLAVVEGLYRDSVELMRIASDVRSEYGLDEAHAVMGTPANRDLLCEHDDVTEEQLASVTPDDLVLAVVGPDAVTEDALAAIQSRLETSSRDHAREDSQQVVEKTVSSAVENGDHSLALISVPGEYAVREAWQALEAGLDVQLFSDNVDVASEQKLKQAARERDQLVMGPDCGTAIVDGVPLGFANEVADGPVGIVSASGTGLQEVSVLVDRLGSGLSHALGVGGRDLSDTVGGITTCQALGLLDDDDATEVIVLISKPPAERAKQEVMSVVEECSTPVVVCLLGDEQPIGEWRSAGETTDTETRAKLGRAATLADAAGQAAEVIAGDAIQNEIEKTLGRSSAAMESFEEYAARFLGSFDTDRTTVRGLFTGGTLCGEAALLLDEHVADLSSNVGIGTALEDPLDPAGNAVIDFGADELTSGRPHPMLDPELRTRAFEATIADDSVAIVVLDLVLGHGTHPNPTAGLVDAMDDCSDPPLVIASVCGTESDPQTRSQQVAMLEGVGINVAPSNAMAARRAAMAVDLLPTPQEAP